MIACVFRFLKYSALAVTVSVAFSSVFAADAPTGSPAVQVGDTLEQIKTKLGDPKSSMKAGTRMILEYPQGTIVLQEGKAVEISLPQPASPASTTPAPAKAASATKAPPAPPVEHPPDVRMTQNTDSFGVTTFTMESDCDLDFTVTIQLTLTNMSCNHPLTYTADSGGKKSFAIAEIWPTDKTQAYNSQIKFFARYGGIGNVKSTEAIYDLPFAGSDTHRIAQGNHGKFSHGEGSQNDYAVDFACPEGTPIAAAREGVVVGIRQDYTEGGTDEKYKSQGNYVIIRHTDGTYAEYYHLKHNCVQVRLGDSVQAGQIIALSGATGYAAGPHLHFAVFENIDGNHRITLPVHYRTPQGVLAELKEGASY